MGMETSATALPAVLNNAGLIATMFAPYIAVGLAFVFGPRLLKMGLRIVKGR